ncbi:hypothetical protein BI350_11915 [Sporosarcina ureilytica]|uniref:Bacteriophage T5 Orf172 DNA-binding domain-containing protein n=1 Tax=Sporosarcina ureilytica TaxID=298596 RepID=A0A1D8JKH8_9BACL|nr:hypothetical protein BI350_11915 [Sporosarcina ureilytica]
MGDLKDKGFDEVIDLNIFIQEKKIELAELEEKYKLESAQEIQKNEKLIEERKAELVKLEKDFQMQKEKAEQEYNNLIKSQVKKKEKLEKSVQSLTSDIEKLKAEIVYLEEEVLMQSFGFYDPKYDLENSASYKVRLDEIRSKQKQMVKDKTATNFYDGWTVNGNKAEGRKMTNNNIRMTLRSFNNECDVAISKVKFNNIEAIDKRIIKAYEALNKMNLQNKITISSKYLNLKLEELYLAYEYAKKVEKEKEEQRQIREQMREEEKARREIEKLKAKVEKEEKHFIQALEKLELQKEDANETKMNELELKIIELKDKLSEVQRQKEDVLNREKNTRAGYVYVISNIGSFGEDIYKIGMTRRLEPMDRVRELGDASVPFKFDVHAMIFSENAPTLESILHNTFDEKRLNLINTRKEYFAVTLEEIQKVVEENHDKTIEFTMTAVAEEYRETKALRKRLENQIA